MKLKEEIDGKDCLGFGRPISRYPLNYSERQSFPSGTELLTSQDYCSDTLSIAIYPHVHLVRLEK